MHPSLPMKNATARRCQNKQQLENGSDGGQYSIGVNTCLRRTGRRGEGGAESDWCKLPEIYHTLKKTNTQKASSKHIYPNIDPGKYSGHLSMKIVPLIVLRGALTLRGQVSATSCRRSYIPPLVLSACHRVCVTCPSMGGV